MSRISDTPPQQTDLFGHPRGLTFLFMTEMWERFSYYSMLALLVLYMVKYLFEPTQVESVFGYAAVKDALEFLFGPLSTQALASHIYGLYTGLLFLTPLIGGLLADRVLGQRATVVVGAVMMSIGQFMLVFESLFFLGLLTLILGNGAFKSNTLTQVGALYAPGDARRDRAFLIVLVGGNVGAFFAPLVSGALAQALGWRYGFASAGVGMLIALVVYLAALPTLPIDELHKAKAAGVKKNPLGPNERRAVLALIMLSLAVTLFWAIYEQQGDRELADAFLTWLKDHVGWVMVNEGMGRHTVLSQQYISNATPTGAALVPDGATFRVWAPSALSVYLNGVFGSRAYDQQTEDRLLRKNPRGYWTGFQKGAQDGDQYRFWVLGVGSSGYKRDPYARELGPKEAFPNCFSILRRSDSYRWHDAAFRTPDFSDMVIYQAHIGTFAISTAGVASNFLDVAAKIPHLAALGINVLQPLPMDEQEVTPSMGYGGADLFAPDFPYVANRAELPDYLNSINGLLDAKNQASLKLEHISSGPNQLKALVDLCHVYGIAVVFDVVYNHAGGFTVNGHLDDNCLYYFDRLPNVNNNNDSLYFTDQDRGIGGLAFAMWNDDVCSLLFDNARYYVEEFHVDGFRYDEISTLLSVGQQTGWRSAVN